MSFETFVGIRYLMAKRRHNVLSVITLISIGGVAVGVMALIVVLSVMGGFEGDLREKIIGAKAHVVVTGEDGYLGNYEAIVERIGEVPGVVGAMPYVEGEVMVNSATNLQGVILRGIDPDRVGDVTNLERDIEEGSLRYLADPNKLPEQSSLRFDKKADGVLIQSDDEDGTPDAIRRRRMRAAGARASVAFAGTDHGRWVRNVLDGKASPPAANAPGDGAPEDVEHLTPTSTHEAASEGASDEGDAEELEDSAPATSETPDEEAVATPGDDPKDAGDSEDAIAEDASEPSDAPEAPAEAAGAATDALTTGETRPATATIRPQKRRRREMKPVPGLEGSEPIERRVAGLVLGHELKSNLNVFLGHEVNVMSPMGDLGPTGSVPKSRPYRVVGVFYSGMYEYDTKFVYATLEDAQRFLNLGDKVTGIEIKIEDVERSAEMKTAIETALADFDNVEVKDWRELNGNLFSALELEKIAMFVILTFIILVASFNIICLLIMIVIEKGREIAIMKSMGANSLSVMKIFVLQGGIIGVLGTAIGCAVGLALCTVIATWGIQLPADVYYLSHVPVEVRPGEVAAICGAAVGISLLATIPPSILAALLDPVAGLRYE